MPIRDHRQQGFSLIELMIAMVLGLAIIAAVGTLSINASRSYRKLNEAGEQIENGRYALNTLRNEIEHAGFLGAYSYRVDKYSPCGNQPSNGFINYPICLKDTELIVTRASTSLACEYKYDQSLDKCVVPAEKIGNCNLTTTKTYLSSTPSSFEILSGCSSADEKCTPKPMKGRCAGLREYQTKRYFIKEKTLQRSLGTLSPEPIIDGVEKMSFKIGLDNPETPDGLQDGAMIEPEETTDWSKVISVLVTLNTCSPPRQGEPCPTFTQTIHLANPSGMMAQ
jgi:prepilin-type N-terminal cleavage/methylation domain-containing protein